VVVDIPLLATFAPSDSPDAGVTPEVLAPPRWVDAAAGVDTKMAAARALVMKWRGGGIG